MSRRWDDRRLGMIVLQMRQMLVQVSSLSLGSTFLNQIHKGSSLVQLSLNCLIFSSNLDASSPIFDDDDDDDDSLKNYYYFYYYYYIFFRN